MDADFVAAVRKRNQGYFASLVPEMPTAFTRIIGGEAIRHRRTESGG